MTLDTSSFDEHRSLPVNAQTLWQLLTDTEHRQSWSAPGPDMPLVAELSDLREGGQDRLRFGPEDAPEFIVETRWYRLAAPQRAVFTETLLAGGAAMFTSLVTYVLEPNGAETDLHLTVAVSSFEGADALEEVKAGWDGGLANLEQYVADMISKSA